MINWNEIVTAKREKLKQLEVEERSRHRKSESDRTDLKDFVFHSLVTQVDSKDVSNTFTALRAVQPHPLPQVQREFDVARKFHVDNQVNLSLNKIDQLKQTFTSDFLKGHEVETVKLREDWMNKAEIMI
jgi:hypothetical protein